MDPAGRPVVILSNRGPLTFREQDGGLVAERGGGGLVSGLAPLIEQGRVTWISAALSDGDRSAAKAGASSAVDERFHLIDVPVDELRRYYDVIANGTLWFVHHGLYDLTREPRFDADWWESWEAYRRVNRRFAEAAASHAPDGAVVLVQDYHLTLVAPSLHAARSDLSVVHFHHIPFAGPDGLRVLPPGPRVEMLDALSTSDACGFHTAAWAENFLDSLRRRGAAGTPSRPRVFHATLNSDVVQLRRTASDPECEAAHAELDRLAGDRRLVVRVDRMELSKNIVRGFEAYDRLLEARADWRGRVTFVACCYPSRSGVPEYGRYRDEVERAAAAVNSRWADDGWTPVHLLTDDDYPRSVAALRRYDVLLVNPVRDGLNLVAKEGPMLNERDGQVVLSTEAGAWTELRSAADGVSPFDVEGTARALADALDRGPDDRRERAALLRDAALARTPDDWLTDQLAALDHTS